MEIEQSTENAPLTQAEAKAEWERMAAEPDSGETSPASPSNPPQQQTQEPDPWAGVPDIVRQKLEGLDRLDQRLRSNEGRVGALQRDVSEARQVAQQMRNAPSQQQIDAASRDGKWKSLMDDYPEWAEAFEERLSSERGASQEFIRRLEQQNQNYERKISELTVEVHHPGWAQTVTGDEFRTWLGKQPGDIASLAASENPQDAIALLNHFKGGRNRADEVLEQRQRRLQTSATPQQRQVGRPPNAISEDGLSDREIWELEANKRAAEREKQRQHSRY